MLHEALCHVADAIASCEQGIDTRNLPKGVEDSIRRAESHLADAAGTLAADLHAVTSDLPEEVERKSIPEMVRIAVEAQRRKDAQPAPPAHPDSVASSPLRYDPS